MKKNINNESANHLESHYEREYNKQTERRKHTHDLIIRVFTTHITVVLAVLGSLSFLLKDGSDTYNLQNDSMLIVQFLSVAIVIGMIFYLSIINLHIARDLYRYKEQKLYDILVKLAFIRTPGSFAEEQINRIIEMTDEYEGIGRYKLKQVNISKFKGKPFYQKVFHFLYLGTSLFKMFRACIYLSNALLTWIAIKLTSLELPWYLAVVAITLVQFLVGRFYKFLYIQGYKHRSDKSGTEK